MAAKPKLLILTDLWGSERSPWIQHYMQLLESDFDLLCYDPCQLAEIENKGLTEQQLHAYFVNGGIHTAVENMIRLEKDPVHILGFSIGGTIAWKAGLKGLKILDLFAVSSTRLRYETTKPLCTIHLVFGENDPFKPTMKWAGNLNLKLEIIENEEHTLYKSEAMITNICHRIKRKV